MVKRIFSYCGAYKHYVFLSPVFVMLETAGELWEVRSIQHWPSHRRLVLQRVR